MRIMSCVAPFRPGIALSFGPKWDTTQGKDERGWNEHEALRGIKTEIANLNNRTEIILLE